MIQTDYIMVDVESNGPCPDLYSMLEVGAVVVEDSLSHTFHAKFRPLIDAHYSTEAMKILPYTMDDANKFPDPHEGMQAFAYWISKMVKKFSMKRPMFISDNNGFDFSFVNYYFWGFMGENPFGHSSTNLGSLYKGLVGTTRKNFKHLRKTRHDHNPVNDAKGNAEAMLHMIQHMGLKA